MSSVATPSDGDPAGGSDPLDVWLAGLIAGEPDVALVAVGSHGHHERAPYSDVDLVLLHTGRRDIATVADRIWYPIWDRGLALDHSVRTPKEAIGVADRDLKAMLGLLDARFVAGDAALASDVVARVRERFQRGAKRWLAELADAVDERHERFGELAFLLEPDVKEAKGGLRDIAAFRAAAVASPIAAGKAESLERARTLLLSIRTALHLRAGRCLDRLVLEQQDGVAADAGFADADSLMSSLSQAARAVAHVSDDTWSRIRSSLTGPRGRVAHRPERLDSTLVLVDGDVVLDANANGWDAALPVAAAAAAARSGARLHPDTLVRLAAEVRSPADPWPPRLRDALVALLDSGAAALPLLDALDHHGLLVRLLPEWAAVRHRHQRNAYHRFTVDRHLCETAANAAERTRDVSRPDLLLVAAWLHDIGKGFPGDHSVVGAELVAGIARRMGFSDEDVAVLADVVRHHLLLPDTATRRDLADPATARAVAQVVRDPLRLEILAVLAEADGLATGPTAWSRWKAGLVADLVERTRAAMSAGEEAAPPPAPADRTIVEAAKLEVGLHGEGERCVVVAADRPGLFSTVAGVLAVNGLDVRSARAGTDGRGRAVEVLDVASESEPHWAVIARDLDAALAGRLDVAERLRERSRQYARRYRRRAGQTAPPRVIVDLAASQDATVIEVRAPDGVGVLFRITRALAKSGLDVRSARVSTLGDDVVDAFYVVDQATGSKVDDADRLAAVQRAVLDELTG